MPNNFDFLWLVAIAVIVTAALLIFIVSFYKNTIKELKINLEEHRNEVKSLNAVRETLSAEKNQLENEVHAMSADLRNLNDRIEDFKIETGNLQRKLQESGINEQQLKIDLTQKSAEIEMLQTKLLEEKAQLTQLNERFQAEFENLANKILDEKSQRFAVQNKENLDMILKPFQEKITELKNTVQETYEKENQQRFSLGEKVKELAELNLQISEDAKRLTRALKSDSKTQGNWGEMILESILEKSGLVKGREYFLEYQLTDSDNKALFSAFSGKKMRPDAVIKYPVERNVIIDSKVSLTAFTEMVDEADADVFEIKQNQHVASVKKHIDELSQKAYDDYDKSLDFVMMFIPSEAAYIAAMQADPNVWQYAYDKRILLMNPGNLITSLKLIADLWKREYQNRNAIEIADRGAKLYEKFIGFIVNLENVGKNIDQAKSVYDQAYKQLHTGRDNLVLQTQKLKDLGLKTKKELPSSLVERSKEHFEHGIGDSE